MRDLELVYGDSEMPPLDAVILSDPPWGAETDCDYTRFTNGIAEHRNYEEGIPGDDEPFDPSPWLEYEKVCLWGYQYFAQEVPLGTILVWLKKRDNQLGTFLSDCELAWMKGGKGVYLYKHIWHGFDRESERGKSLHPSQKPVALMRWCIEKMKIPKGALIADPYMGSGPVGVAAVEMGYSFWGREKVKEYYDKAKERIMLPRML